MTYLGRVASVDTQAVRAFLAADAAAGATTLTVVDTTDLPEFGPMAVGDDAYMFTVVGATELIIDPSLGTDLDEGSALELPLFGQKIAQVMRVTGSGDPEVCRIPFGLRVYDQLEDGIRAPGAGEIVLVDTDEDGPFVSDLPSEEAGIPGAAIFGPLPNAEIPSVTPVAPSSSPMPTVTGYAGLLQVRFDGVPNGTFVDYDIHVAATNANPPSESTLLFNTAATIEAVRELPDGTPLAYDTDYFVAIWAKSGDQYAENPSPWVSGRMDRTRSADLAVDALDGRVITGSTVRTAASGARVQIDTANGLVGYAPDGTTKKTQVDAVTGRIYAEDGTFTGSLVGGNISIAQGVASTLDQDFETASGTTPPTGWTRTVVGSAGTAGDVDFQTSGGNPGRWLRLRSPQITAAGGTAPNRITYPTALSAQDVIVEFDYRWTGAQVTDAFNIPEMGVLLRANPANPGDPNFATGVRVFFVNGMWRVITGSGDIASATSAVPINTVARVRIVLRGATLSIQVGTQEPTRLALNIAPAVGPVVFRSYLSTFFGASSVDQTVMIDNLHIEVLQTGLNVARDGKTSVEYLQVNQAAVVPDPILPTDAATKRYVDLRRLDQAAAPTNPVAMGNQRLAGLGAPTAGTDAATKAYVDALLSGNPIAFPLNSGYSMHTFGSRPYYRVVSKDFVKVGGVITKSSGNFGTSFEDIGQLPAGFRCDTGDSQNQQFFMLGATAATTFGRARVADNGTISVQASASASYLPIDGILIDLRATRAAL